MKSVVVWLVACAFIGLLGGCEQKAPPLVRGKLLGKNRGDVVIAVAWPLQSGKRALLDGVQMAADEINAAGGVLDGRKIVLRVKDDESSLSKGRLVAQEIANDPQVSAVIGHLNTYITLPAAETYERSGILMITPGSSGQRITERGNKLIFRNLPSNREQGRQMGDYALGQHFNNIAIYYIKNDYGVDLANQFEQRANELGMHIVDRRSYTKDRDNHAAVFEDWASFLKLDAVFLAGAMPEGPAIVRAMRAAGISAPIFSGAGLDSAEFVALGGKDVEDTVVFSLYNPASGNPLAARFNEAYGRRYHRPPESVAAQGYDTMRLLAAAIKDAASAEPARIAAALHQLKDWQGVTGAHSFDANGERTGARMTLARVAHGAFVFEQPAPAPERIADAH
jgi:branched-chain amino acid transport system substrate-binding protein